MSTAAYGYGNSYGSGKYGGASGFPESYGGGYGSSSNDDYNGDRGDGSLLGAPGGRGGPGGYGGHGGQGGQSGPGAGVIRFINDDTSKMRGLRAHNYQSRYNHPTGRL